MTNAKLVFLALTFFGLGFVASEYRHGLNLRLGDASQVQANINREPANRVLAMKGEITGSDGSLMQSDIAPSEDSVENVVLNGGVPTEGFSWARVNQLIRNENYSEAIRLLTGYLETDANSVQAWFLLANCYQKQDKHKLAIDAWFHYLKLEVDAKKIEQAIKQVKHYLSSLSDKPALVDNEFTWLIAQLEALQNFRQNDGELHLALAGLYLQVEDAYQAQYHALMAANDPVAQKRAEEILAKLNGKPVTDELAIPLLRFGNQFLVNVSIEGHSANLLLDTGASLSGVAKSYAAKYPSIVKATKPIRLNTASGTEDSYLFTVENLSFGSLVFSQHILALLPMNSAEEFDGLLGVDILGRFDFVIDQDAAVLRLRERKK